ncbi:alpha/beta fold hydrolase [Bacillus suaedae]|uniref:Alpha/beta hydrolase n=1 Tax=Halalkalibacter suaedae TaxID=2822140 RepID=A0A941ATE7_9BACI|nr:alpha/beta hydrolase [Bacillus suaedae]MBP3951554.1 alpha/beta hydrolase [Bacillus suaedae]
MILHTTINGEGEPLVLIHSGGMTGHTEYEEQSDYFAANNYKVIRPDLRGHGKSNGRIENYFSHCADDIHDTLDSLNLEECHIAGVSIGGIVALLFAKNYPEKVKSLSFSGIYPIEPDNWNELSREEAERYEQLFNNMEAVDYLSEIHGGNDWKSLLHSFCEDDFYPFHETGDVSMITIPTLCIVGEKENVEVSAAITYKQLNPAFHIAIIPFAGHLVHREQPELYSHTLEAFLKNQQIESEEN